MRFFRSLSLALLLPFTSPAFANPPPQSLQELALQELATLQDKFTDQYAPGALKTQLFGWNLNQEVADAQEKIRALPFGNLVDYQRILREFEVAAHDYHVSITFASAEQSALPFRIRGAEGRYFVSEIDTASLPADVPLQVGDELISFDGGSVDSAVAAVQQEVAIAVDPATDLSRAEADLTLRTASSAMDIPTGPVAIGVIPRGQTVPVTYTLQWEYTPPIASAGSTPAPGSSSVPGKADSRILLDSGQDSGQDSGDFGTYLGTKSGVLPALGAVTWQAPDSDLLRAYIFTAGGQSYGYIRLADFSGDETRIEDLTALIAQMEDTTAALVIDETDNPGGQSYYLNAVVSLLVTEPVPTALFHVSLSQETMAEAKQEISELTSATSDPLVQKALGATDYNGYPITLALGQSVSAYDEFLEDQQRAGLHISDAHYRKLETILPRPGVTTYSKPILILTNESDFSCADMFPALMQDLGRAKTFGATTSGAGGNNNIENATPSALNVKQTSITISSELRPDGTYLEDAGVTPDFPYVVTADDLQNGYPGYIQAVQAALAQMTGSQSPR